MIVEATLFYKLEDVRRDMRMAFDKELGLVSQQ
jgi:hypothetical protein